MMNCPFDTHEITHLSASSMNLFRENPALWCVKYLFKVFDEANVYMQRGLETEERLYTAMTTGEITSSELVSGDLVQSLYESIKPRGELISYQKEIRLEIDDVPVPIKGYLDFEFEDVIVDLKTSSKTPSKLSNSHELQGALYTLAENKPTHFLFGIPLKTKVNVVDIPLEYVESQPNNIYRHCKAIENCLSFSSAPEGVAQLFVPDFSKFGWGDNTKAFAQELWQVY